METEQGLYAKVFMLHRDYMKTTKENKNKNEGKFKFQGNSARSQHWFDLDFDWTGEICSTCEPDLYRTKNKIQIHLKCLKFQSKIQNMWRK